VGDQVNVIGHRHPDTDSICSAIAYTELKKKQGVNAVAGRLGEINRETAFVLEYFGLEAPQLIETVKTQISDLEMDKVSPVSPSISIKAAWNLMNRDNIKTLPVTDEKDRLIGVVSLTNITNPYMDALDNTMLSASQTSLHNIVDTLNGKIVCGKSNGFFVKGKVVILSSTAEIEDNGLDSSDVFMIGNHEKQVLRAIEAGAKFLVLTYGFVPNNETLKAAEAQNVVIVSTATDTFTAARLMNQSTPISFIMSKDNIVVFHEDDFVDEVNDKMLRSHFRNYPVVDNDQRFKGLISEYHLLSRRSKKVILMDHNEKNQTVDGIDDAEILEIIDHHKLGDIQTMNPIKFKNEPLGSTSTIVANCYFEAGIHPSKKVAGILCAAIISDTIKFKSPTSTSVDSFVAEKLAQIAGIDIEEFALKMFKAGSTLKNKKPQEIMGKDYKEFTFSKYKVGISQEYTIDFDSLNEIKADLLLYMDAFRKENGLNIAMLLVTDILNPGSEVLFVGDGHDVLTKAFGIGDSQNSVFLPGVLSRKKQIIPLLSAAMN